MWRGRMQGSNERFRRICVFCGSSSGNKTAFSDAALDLGKQLVHPLSPSGEDICWFLFESVTPTGFYPQNKRKGIKNSVHNCVVILAPKRDKVTCPRGTDWVERRIDLVYGGGSVGLMGLISQTVHDGGCHVLGVIPTALMPHEISGETVGEVKTVTDMHERKAEMARQADAFIALPGGYGTMEELLEMITWSQLGIHDKPVGLLNVDGYYNCLLALFDKGVEEGFIKPAARHIVVSAPTAKELILQMEEYVPMHDQVAPRTSWEIEQLGFSNDH